MRKFHVFSGPKVSKSGDHYLVSYKGSGNIEIDEKALYQYTRRYFKELFSGVEPHLEIVVKRGIIHLLADLPSMPLEAQKQLVEKIEADLHKLFEKQFGYKEDFHLNISFSGYAD